MPSASYRPRIADQRLEELFTNLPAVMIVGPRACGKSTTARRLAGTVVQLDREIEAAPFRADPDAALAAFDEPILIDEWQLVPEVLGAVKRAVDRDFRPGRFLLTGSARAKTSTAQWPGTGRIVTVVMQQMAERELVGGQPTTTGFLDRLGKVDRDLLSAASNSPDLLGYVDLALRGGFPEIALATNETARKMLLSDYIDQLLSRDPLSLGTGTAIDVPRLRRYFTALCLNTAGIPEHRTLYEAAGISRDTATKYDRLLTDLFIADVVPAWHSNRLRRLVRAPKRFIVDPSLVASALNLDRQALMRDGQALGRMIETFTAAQIRAEVNLDPGAPGLHHLREKQGRRKIDLIAEYPNGDVLAIEIKAAGQVRTADYAHLAWLRDQLGDRFRAGVVLHTGPQPYVLEERLFAAPISTLWADLNAPL